MFTDQCDSDNYSTDKKGWEIIKDFIPTDKQIWSPFYSDGKMKGFFKEMGIDIIHLDEDFFSNNRGEIIIDNPPFSIFPKVCQRLIELDKPFIIIAFSRVLLFKWFQKLFKNQIQIIIPLQRPTFTHLVNPKKGYTPPYGVMYFCYKMNFDKDIMFI